MMDFLKKYFIPHENNAYKPHFFREASIIALSLVIIIIFAVAVSGRFVLIRSDFSAAIISSVLVDLANEYRQSENTHALIHNPVLEEAARLKAEDMAKRGYFAHESPEGREPWYWFQEVGYDYTFAGENLAANFSDSTEVNLAWINSPGHRANLSSSNFTEIGIATARGMYEGRETVFVVELFGRPALKLKENMVQFPEVSNSSNDSSVLALDSPSNVFPKVESAFTSSPDSDEDLGEFFVEIESENKSASVPSSLAANISETKYYPLFDFAKTAVASPTKTLSALYFVLAVIITLAFVMMIFVEIRRQHPAHILYGVSLLFLMGALLYLYKFVLFGPLLII